MVNLGGRTGIVLARLAPGAFFDQSQKVVPFKAKSRSEDLEAADATLACQAVQSGLD
jgi:hypothetical protein